MDNDRQQTLKQQAQSEESAPLTDVRPNSIGVEQPWYRNKKFLVSVIAGGGLFAFFLYKLDLRAFQEILSQASIPWIAASLLFFCLQIVVRAFRLIWVFDPGRIGIKQALVIQNLHVPLTNILPAGLGDASLLYLLKRVAGVNFGAGAGCYLVLRTIEVSMCLLMFLALTLNGSVISGITGEIMTRSKIIAAIILIGVVAFYFILLSARFQGLIASLQNRDFPGWVQRILHLIDEIRRQIKHSLGSRGFVLVVMYSAVFYVFVFFNLYSVFRSFHADLTFAQVFFFFVMLFPFQILPIKGPMNAGTFEFSWVVLLVLMGLGKKQAVVLAFAGHTIALLNVLLSFLLFGLVFTVAALARRGRHPRLGA